jgi:sec-independent protein translocase protein TatB
MIREAELEEMEKKWKEENERIMRDYPTLPADPPAELPSPTDAAPPPANEPPRELP